MENRLQVAMDGTFAQWNTEAEMFCTRHARNLGAFQIIKWANGQIMAKVPGSRCNQEIPIARLAELCANGWNL